MTTKVQQLLKKRKLRDNPVPILVDEVEGLKKIIKLTTKKPVSKAEEWSMFEKLLLGMKEMVGEQKTVSLDVSSINTIKGEDGKDGEDGKNGDKGIQGSKGNIGETGQRGEQGGRGLVGIRGKQGSLGKQGVQGNEGDKGDTGNDGFIPKHEFKTGQLRFENPDGTWGAWIDLTKLMDETGKKFGGKTLHRGFAPRFQDDETPSGDVNSSNKEFTLASTPVSGSLKLYLGGVRMSLGEGDYTLSGNTITTTLAPETNTVITVDYRI